MRALNVTVYIRACLECGIVRACLEFNIVLHACIECDSVYKSVLRMWHCKSVLRMWHCKKLLRIIIISL